MSRLLDRVREAIRTRYYSIRTEEAYVRWTREYILFFGKRHPDEMGAKEISIFISHLAVERRVAASTQTQALSALLFLYREVLDKPVEWVDDIERAKRPRRLPVVFTMEEVRAVLGRLRGEPWLMASLLYGSGLQLMECVRLRVKDVDFARLQITVREGKGNKDRVTMLPPSLAEHLRMQLERAKALHEADMREGFGRVHLPYALARKYGGAEREWCWQYVFPASKQSFDPRTGREQRHHIAETTLQKAVKAAIRAAGVEKSGSCHTLRHSFATHLLEAGYDIRTIQERASATSPSTCSRATSRTSATGWARAPALRRLGRGRPRALHERRGVRPRHHTSRRRVRGARDHLQPEQAAREGRGRCRGILSPPPS